jgi:hypothetical protein
MCLMAKLKKCMRHFSEVLASQWQEEAGIWHAKNDGVESIARLYFKSYKMRLVQAITPAHKAKRHGFCEEMQLKMEVNVQVLLIRVLPQCWIGCAANGDNNLLLWRFVKDSVYVPPFPMPFQELHDWITHALQAITADMLYQV